MANSRGTIVPRAIEDLEDYPPEMVLKELRTQFADSSDSQKLALACALAHFDLVDPDLLVLGVRTTDLTACVKEIISKYFEATGGLENHTDIKSMVRAGEISMPTFGVKGTVEAWLAVPNKGFVKVDIPGVDTQRQGYDGETAWRISKLTGEEILIGGRADQVIRELDLHPFVNFEKQYESVKCTGTEEFSREQCFVVVAQPAGDETKPITYYFAVDSGLHLGSKRTAITPLGEMGVVMTSSDYRDLGGIKFSYKTSVDIGNGMTQSIQWNSVKLNPDVDEATFVLPAEIKALKDEK